MKRILSVLAALAAVAVSGVVMAAPAQAAARVGATRLADSWYGVQLVNVRYGECLDQVGGGQTQDTPIGHYPCGSADNRQRWNVVFVADKYICSYEDWLGNCNEYVLVSLFQVRSQQSGMCAHPKGGGTGSGTTIVQRWCVFDSLRDMWVLDQGPNGGFFFHSAKAFDDGQQLRAIDAPPFSQDYRVRLWTHDGGATAPNTAQEWLMRP